MVLPANHQFTKLLIETIHKKNLHSSPQATLAAVRQYFWLLNSRNSIRSVLRKCVTCFKAQPRSTQPMMGDLPKGGVCSSIRPFLQSGVDYCGS